MITITINTMRLIYTIGIWFYTLGIRLAALFGHEKAQQMVKGWKDCVNVLNTQTFKHSNIQNGLVSCGEPRRV